MLFATLVSVVSLVPLIGLMLALQACVSTETITAVLPSLLEHWPFVAFSALVWAGGQAAKHLAPPPSTKGWKLFWRTLPYHPVAAGVIFGITPFAVLPAVIVKVGASGALYYGASGVLASYAHDVWKTWIKYKHMDEKDS